MLFSNQDPGPLPSVRRATKRAIPRGSRAANVTTMGDKARIVRRGPGTEPGYQSQSDTEDRLPPRGAPKNSRGGADGFVCPLQTNTNPLMKTHAPATLNREWLRFANLSRRTADGFVLQTHPATRIPATEATRKPHPHNTLQTNWLRSCECPGIGSRRPQPTHGFVL
jgi:hypothetical protein